MANGPMLYVMALGEGLDNRQLSVSRLFRVRARAHLQGAPASVGMLGMTEKVGKRVFGNAMALPVIGSALAMEMPGIMPYWSPQKLANLSTVCMTQTSLRSALPESIHPPGQKHEQHAITG